MAVISARGGAKASTVVVPQPVASLRISNPLRSPVSISYNVRNVPPAVIALLRAETGDPTLFRIVHLPAGDYGVGAEGARWVGVPLDGGEQAVELVPFEASAKVVSPRECSP